MEQIVIRPATVQDVPQMLGFIRELAEYEHLSDQVVATEAGLAEWVFVKKKAEALICECEGEPAGFALYFFNFSTFLGKAGIFIEDLYVKPAFRKRGLGKALFIRLAQICLEQGCGRLEWNCLDWNTPSIEFYKAMGGNPLSDWTTYRIMGAKLERLGQIAPNAL